MTWGDDAFARAKREQKPVFLAIGAFTSELSRAMARQSFANAEVAAFLNANFVCVIADAKESPALTSLGQNYVSATKQLHGLPLNLWLTPELKPFEGSTYLPPTEEWGKEGFFNAIKRVAAAWKADPTAQRHKADEAIAAVAAAQPSPAPPAVDAAEITRLITAGTDNWRARFDSAHGGFGDPPKYPEPELLRVLLRDAATRDMAFATLRAIVNGALRDPLDGGFFRYVVDAEWRQPYFQKTPGDQARLALALLEAAEASGDVRFADAARGALTYALDRLADPKHEYAAAEDATREDAAASYFWTADEIREIVGEDDAPEFCRVYGVTAEGNVPADAFAGVATKGKNLLYLAGPAAELPAGKSLAAARAKLLQRRLQRAAPRRDGAATSGAHGLMLAALARASAQLSEPRFAAAAKAEVVFIRDHLRLSDGGLRHLADRAIAAAPEDYAFVVDGLLAFQAATGDAGAKHLALELVAAANARFWDEASGRYFTIPDATAPGVWARVHAPPPGAGDPPSPEAAMLIAIAQNSASDKSLGELAGKLTRALAADLKDSSDSPRGDLLLALQTAQKHE